MNYLEIKKTFLGLVKQGMKEGKTQEQAEQKVLMVTMSLLDEQKLGVSEVIIVFRVLNYEFIGELGEKMEKCKKVIRKDYHIDEAIKSYRDIGLSEHAAILNVIREIYDWFDEGKIESPELVNLYLWTMGYRLKEKFFEDYYAGKKPELSYEEDD